jgi:very-short-patch-repair endonuclease
MDMFYGATSSIFEKAKELRNNMTLAEKTLWYRLKKSPNGLKFRRQHPVSKYIADFYCHAAKLIIEVDGDIHNFQKDYDKGREYELNELGIKVLRFTNEEVNNIDTVMGKILNALPKPQ